MTFIKNTGNTRKNKDWVVHFRHTQQLLLSTHRHSTDVLKIHLIIPIRVALDINLISILDIFN